MPELSEDPPQDPASEPFSFEDLYRDSVADVHGYAISLLGDRASAEDVTALAFERLFKSRSRLDRRRGTPRSLLFAIARNAALDELRRRRRQPELVPDPEPAGVEDPGEAFARLERRETVRAALSGLSLREREIVLLKFHGQLSNAELGRVLQISETNAATRLHRALSRLRANCAEPGREEVA
jgi:RNA polymerase sigma-70 factor (ECF subfamily)